MTNLITEKKHKFEISPGQQKVRIDTFLTSQIENCTRSKIQKLIKAEYVLVNGNTIKPNYVISPNEVIDVTIPCSPRPENAEPEDIPIDIVYEDEYLMVVNKPAGMVVHPAFGNYTGTLVNALLHHSKELSEVDEPGRAGLVHRIDKDTTGLLLIAKDDFTHAALAKQFADRTTTREYWAVCWAIFDEREGEIVKKLTRSKRDRKIFVTSETEGKHAHTNYWVMDEYEFASLVKLKLNTGRTHQIRVHMSSIHHPIFGDTTYGGNQIVCATTLPKMKQRVNNLLEIMPRQALHAKTLGFYHPHKKEEMIFDSELPDDMKLLIEKLSV